MYNKVFVFRVPVNASIKSRHTTYSILGGIRVIREDNSACLWIKCMQFCESIPVIILVMLHAFEETANIFHKVLSQVQYNLCNQIEQIYIGLSIMYMHTSNIFSAIVRQLTWILFIVKRVQLEQLSAYNPEFHDNGAASPVMHLCNILYRIRAFLILIHIYILVIWNM